VVVQAFTDLIWALAALGVVGLLAALVFHFLKSATPSDLEDAYDAINDETADRIEDKGDRVSDADADAADQRVRDTADDLGVDSGDGFGKPDATVDEDGIIREVDWNEDV
jgi:hypothetical protein